MRVSSSEFYSGHHHIDQQKNRKLNSANPDQNSRTTEDKIVFVPTASEAKDLVLNEYSKNQNAFKDKLTLYKQQALSQYHATEMLEKREYARTALGFSEYA